MQIDILTLFPEMFQCVLNTSVFNRAIASGLVRINVHNIRDYTHDKHHTVDDYPFGGGAGMVMKPEPIFESVEAVKAFIPEKPESLSVILLSPQGRLFSHPIARQLSKYDYLILICGHYEGVDERVSEHLVTNEISIGDYVLSGGELPAMVVMEAVIRLIPGVLGSEISPLIDSHAMGLLEYPQYTRPRDYRGWQVPEILLSGNHAEVARWQREQSIIRTFKRRLDLVEKADLSSDEKKLLDSLKKS